MLTSNIQQIAKVVKGELNTSQNTEFIGIRTDTRLEVNGSLFIAIEGPNFDGHNFVNKAKNLGASAVLAHKKIDINLPVIQVQNTEKAYH